MSSPARDAQKETTCEYSGISSDSRSLLFRLLLPATGAVAVALLEISTSGIINILQSAGSLPSVLHKTASGKIILAAERERTDEALFSCPSLEGWSLFGLPVSATPLGGKAGWFLVALCQSGKSFSPSATDAMEDVARQLKNEAARALGRSALPDREESLRVLHQFIEKTGTLSRRAVFSLIHLNLDHLSLINDRYGWDTADLILAEMIRRLRSVLPEGCFLSSIGGGHFMVLTPPGTTAVTTRSLVNAILQISSTPVSLDMGAVPFSISAGWSVYPQDANDANQLILAARAALTEANRTGGGHERRANAELTNNYALTANLEQDLLKAVEDDALFLKWMPIVDTVSQKIVGHEALLRWTRPGHGEVAPNLFIRYAEEVGMIEALDSWSLRSACMAALRWQTPLRVCVNVSPAWLVNERLSGLVDRVLGETGLAPGRLQIELSECRPFGPSDIAFRELSRVRALGVRLAIDDFGAGYSSLERLRIYPLDQIKLDRAFVQYLGEDMRADEIMHAILSLARSLNITCCAKGVETEHQMALLDANGCEEVQGYLLGAPVRDSHVPHLAQA
ncbi:bifunctional diguanylate cyclase/phosphodiesterase [Gluconobacter sp. Dm-62]|uniref:putative bifunctional diguanylate cyclase/phosphodiesterase n=1 Tax=Gluconobacter sp. Dm-62 TaxID=2799804 RepID=UPI001B8BD6EE|nr:bifunctional diguanylate cyclase/phosphodiesterase [Gluconobacter sp. Dm-62]MBS1101899.1 bifunctional diguanylate cyclase/phosphodiesterase [Gluconobacter sp. Dm-62]